MILKVSFSVGHEFSPQKDLHIMPSLPSLQSLFAWGLAWEIEVGGRRKEEGGFAYTGRGITLLGASQVVLAVEEPACQFRNHKTWVWLLGQEDPLEKGMATHSSNLVWRIAMDRGAWQATVELQRITFLPWFKKQCLDSNAHPLSCLWSTSQFITEL